MDGSISSKSQKSLSQVTSRRFEHCCGVPDVLVLALKIHVRQEARDQ